MAETSHYRVVQPPIAFEDRLQTIFAPPHKYPTFFSDPAYLLKTLLPCTIPIIIALEFVRRIFDEEISKHGLLAGIREGGDPELNFLKVLPTLKKAVKILTREQKRALKEEEYLKSIPEEEKEYLLDMRLLINDKIEEVSRTINEEGN